MAPDALPANVHVSSHPCLLAKISRLRSRDASAADVKTLVNDISLMVGCEALATSLRTASGRKDVLSLGGEYVTTILEPQSICIVPILRSGLAMVEAIQTLLPSPVPVHHLGMYREPSTLSPVEYYNNLPHRAPDPPLSSSSNTAATSAADGPDSRLAILVDPVIATGGTCVAAIQTLREWGVRRIVVVSVLGYVEGVRRVADEWADGTEIWIAGLDDQITAEGMLKPGLGDIGDRLYMTTGN